MMAGPTRAVPNLYLTDIDQARPFYTDVLGFDIGMEAGFMTTFVAGTNRSAQISIFTADPSGFKPQYSIDVGDVAAVDAVHERAVAAGHAIVYPLTDESWGVRRFFVRDPAGALANILAHRNAED